MRRMMLLGALSAALVAAPALAEPRENRGWHDRERIESQVGALRHWTLTDKLGRRAPGLVDAKRNGARRGLEILDAQLAARDFIAHKLRCDLRRNARAEGMPRMLLGQYAKLPRLLQAHVFADSDIFHFRSDDAAPGIMHLGHVGAGAGAAVSAPRATAELVETGIRLRVTPHITADRKILMQMHAERSSAQLAATDIGVYEVRPGIIHTAMTSPPKVHARHSEFIARGGVPAGRWGQPEDVGGVALGQQVDDLAEEGQVGTGEDRHTHGVGVLGQGRLDDLLGGLVQAGVDHLDPGIPQGPGDDLGASVMAVEAGLGHDHAQR